MHQNKCPSKEQLRAYTLGKLPEDLANQTERHLQVCPACETTADSLDTESDSLIVQLQRLSNDPLLAERECAAAISKAKLLAEKVALEGEPSADPTVTPPTELRCLGEFRLLAKMRSGGMGQVYKAQHTRLKKTVALKVLSAERTSDLHSVLRFTRKMEAIGQLDHPNIVQAYDARDIDGVHVLVMEYIDGKDLSRVVERVGPLKIADACELVRQAALGLQYAYEHGLVHRDIKPSNLMVSGKGQLKILDLGLALLDTGVPQGAELTSPGSAIGTADYMAPEQVSDAHSVDIRADIYALGCTLYKLLTGQAPFGSPQYATHAEKLVGHLKGTPPPVRELRDDVSPELAAVIERMMCKSPTDRFATPAEVAEAMASFTSGCDLPALAAEAHAAAERALAAERSLSGTQPFANSAVVDTDATGLAMHSKPRVAMAAPPCNFADSDRVKSRWNRRRRFWIAACAAAMFASVLFGVFIKLQTREGELTVIMDDPDATLQVLSEKNEVVIQRKGEKGTVTIGLAQGKGRLRAVKGGVELFSQEFSLSSGGRGNDPGEAGTSRAARLESGPARYRRQ